LEEQRGSFGMSQNGEVYIRGGNYVVPYIVAEVGQTTMYYNEYIVRSASVNKVLTATPAGSYALAGVDATLTQVKKRGIPLSGMQRKFLTRRINI
jgi:hypothetical protein